MKKIALLLLLTTYYSFSQTKTIDAGSIIIDTGISPQTYGNALKPYGLVYNLLDVQKVPVLWSINPLKIKDGIDFTVDGRNFRSGVFVIEKKYTLTPNVQAAISSFNALGVVTYTTISPVTIPVYRELVEFPKWVLDTANGAIAQNYLNNASIPATSYRFALPTGLTNCDDLFILPHADPTWANHGPLFSWNNSITSGGNRGWLWVACHAASVLEGVFNPLIPSQKLNFLATDPQPSMVPFGIHADAAVLPYTYSNPTDAPMQFLGPIDTATRNGSEQVYLPSLSGGWRPTTTVSVWDPNHSQIAPQATGVAILSPGKAAKMAYGFGFGDTTRGKVMYESGHNHNINSQDGIAAQRAMLNFSFDAPTGKSATITEITSPPTSLINNTTTPLSISVSSTSTTIQWTSSCGGVFSLTTSATTNFTAPLIALGSPNVNCIVTVVATDLCGRESFKSFPITIIAPPNPPIATNDVYYTYNTNSIIVSPLLNDTDIDNNIDPNSLINTTPLVVSGGEFILNSNGTYTFIPTPGFTGIATLGYKICDLTPLNQGGPLCTNATIRVNIVGNSCSTNQVATTITDYGNLVSSSVTWNTPANALGAPNATGSNSTAATGAIIIDLGADAYIGSTIQFRIFSTNASNVTGTIDASTSTTFPVSPVAVSTVATLAAPQIVTFTVTQANTRFVRITGINRFGLESITYNRQVCTSASADIAIVKTVNNATPNVGSNVVFTLTATNNGSNTATNVVATDVLPSGYTFVSSTPSVGTYSAVNGNWTIGNLILGSTATLNITASVISSGNYLNSVSISGLQNDPVNTNNSNSIGTVPVPVSDLEIQKTINVSNPIVGSTIVFTLKAINNGPSNATGVIVNDFLPNGYTYVSDNSGGTYDPITGIWTIGNLLNGNNSIILITATVNP